MTTTPITPFRMPPDLKAEAKAQADKEGISLSQFVFNAIRKAIKNQNK